MFKKEGIKFYSREIEKLRAAASEEKICEPQIVTKIYYPNKNQSKIMLKSKYAENDKINQRTRKIFKFFKKSSFSTFNIKY